MDTNTEQERLTIQQTCTNYFNARFTIDNIILV